MARKEKNRIRRDGANARLGQGCRYDGSVASDRFVAAGRSCQVNGHGYISPLHHDSMWGDISYVDLAIYRQC